MGKLEIVEVGARDGLQNESVHFTTTQKVRLIKGALDAGLRRIEVASFVHPKLVPQMADAEAVIAALDKTPEACFIGLVLNKRGYFRAVEARDKNPDGLHEIGCVAVASDGFGKNNQGQTKAEAIQNCLEIMKLAKQDGLSVQVTISTAFGCPFDGTVNPDTVIDVAQALCEGEPKEIAIADTIGVATPVDVQHMVHALKPVLGHIPLRAHFHNTRNTGIANAWAAYAAGVCVLDSSIGGLGGCPFAPGATGNIATEDLVYMFKKSGISVPVDLQKLIKISKQTETTLGRPVPSMVTHAGGFPSD